MMGWVTIEDVQGNIELVLFPRTWAQYELTLEVGGIIIVDGKVDANSAPPKILVDAIRTEIEITVPADEKPAQPAAAKADRKLVARSLKPAQAVAEPKPVYQVASAELSDYTPSTDWEDENTPPPPDAFPPGWDSFIAPPGGNRTEPAPLEKNGTIDQQPAGKSVIESAPEPQVAPAVVEKTADTFPVIVPPPARSMAANGLSTLVAEDHPPQLVTILLRPSNDKLRDLRRIQRLHGTFISHPGKDHFTFHIFEEGKGHLIEFPNDTTHVCAELLDKLKGMVGAENIRLEPITYQ
jgi:DNA polymerase-3 subunit alpha